MRVPDILRKRSSCSANSFLRSANLWGAVFWYRSKFLALHTR
jgi:hypothetical protein